MVNQSTSKETYGRNLEPRPSIARTSISIPSVSSTTASAHLFKLELACKYLTPVIDEIISRATSYTRSEFRALLSTKSPICAISSWQYAKACRASEIINGVKDKLQLDPFRLPKYVVNVANNTYPQKRAHEPDRVYVDKDLMKQLVDLHSLIRDTIRRLNESISHDREPIEVQVDKVRADLEQKFIVVDQNESNEIRGMTSSTPETAGVRTLTVDVDKNIKAENFPKESEITAMPPTLSDYLVPELEPLPEEQVEIEKDNTDYADPPRDEENSDFVAELKYQPEPEEDAEAIPDGYDCDCHDDIIVKEVSEEKLCPEDEGAVDHLCRAEVSKLKEELASVKQILRDLSADVALIKNRGFPDMNRTAAGTEMQKQQLETEILESLKELRQIKDLLNKMDNPDLILDTGPRDPNEPCCKVHDSPHIHARLNGIPVVVKVNKSSIDILLSECDKFPRKPNEVELVDEVPEVNEVSEVNEVNEVIEVKVNKSKVVAQPEPKPRLCRCKALMEQERLFGSNNRTYDHTKHNSVPYPIVKYEEETVQRPQQVDKPKKYYTNVGHEPFNDDPVVQSAFTNHFDRDLEQCESISGLPYTVHKKSLPNTNICPPMDIPVGELKDLMRSKTIVHPKTLIRRQLTAVGVDNLIMASIPAECCRKAVINEPERDEEPFHASINSLPLTNSDLQIICKENLAPNIHYYTPKSRVYQVWFFHIFRKNDKANDNGSKAGLGERLSEVLRRIIYNDAGYAASRERARSAQPPPPMKHKKCQTYVSMNRGDMPINPKGQHTGTEKKERVAKTTSPTRTVTGVGGGGGKRSRSVQCGTAEETNVGKNGKRKSNGKRNPKTPPEKQPNFSPDQSVIYACNANLGTIYESDEKRQRKERVGRTAESFYDFLRSPDASDSFQKIASSEAAIRALERGNLNNDQFWGMYFEAKRSHRSMGCDSSKRSRSRKNSASKIPKRIVKHAFSSSSSDVRTNRKKKRMRTQERKDGEACGCDCKEQKCTSRDADTVPMKLMFKIKPKEPPTEKHAEAESDMLVKCDSDGNEKAKIFFTKSAQDTSPSADLVEEHSVESLQVLASKNGPGYITVLHPECGCPAVSLFIPCYCDGSPVTNGSELSQLTALQLSSRSDGRHIVLTKGCRVDK